MIDFILKLIVVTSISSLIFVGVAIFKELTYSYRIYRIYKRELKKYDSCSLKFWWFNPETGVFIVKDHLTEPIALSKNFVDGCILYAISRGRNTLIHDRDGIHMNILESIVYLSNEVVRYVQQYDESDVQEGDI